MLEQTFLKYDSQIIELIYIMISNANVGTFCGTHRTSKPFCLQFRSHMLFEIYTRSDRSNSGCSLSYVEVGKKWSQLSSGMIWCRFFELTTDIGKLLTYFCVHLSRSLQCYKNIKTFYAQAHKSFFCYFGCQTMFLRLQLISIRYTTQLC